MLDVFVALRINDAYVEPMLENLTPSILRTESENGLNKYLVDNAAKFHHPLLRKKLKIVFFFF